MTTWQIIISLVGSGLLTTMLAGFLKQWIAKDFPTREDLNGLGTRVKKVEYDNRDMATQVGINTKDLAVMTSSLREHAERIAEGVMKPLQSMVITVDQISKRQERHDAVLELIVKRLDKIESSLD